MYESSQSDQLRIWTRALQLGKYAKLGSIGEVTKSILLANSAPRWPTWSTGRSLGQQGRIAFYLCPNADTTQPDISMGDTQPVRYPGSTHRVWVECSLFSTAEPGVAYMLTLGILRCFYWREKGTSSLKNGNIFPNPHHGSYQISPVLRERNSIYSDLYPYKLP
jgi:hypothetical protein